MDGPALGGALHRRGAADNAGAHDKDIVLHSLSLSLRPGSLMARFNVEGSHAMPKLCERLQIPFRRCGALVLCFNEADRSGLEELLLRGVKNGVHGLRIVEREELHELEPNVSSEAVAALYAPTSRGRSASQERPCPFWWAAGTRCARACRRPFCPAAYIRPCAA